jgi:hypothetical protein
MGKNPFFKEFMLKKYQQQETRSFYQPNNSYSKDTKEVKHDGESEKKQKIKESPEDKMVRELQGIFCTGRYRSWVLYNNRIKK